MPHRSVIERAQKAFGSTWRPMLESRAPGRLELLGNHVDYNGGRVLAGAIDRTVTAYACQASEPTGTTSLIAVDLGDDIETVNTHDPQPCDTHQTTMPVDYLAGILHVLGERHVAIRDGLQILVTGNVPRGFGMSSSAALCVALTNLLADADLTDHQIVEIARRAEHLTGAPVGAMDQSASVAGGVILFDGASGSVTPITPDLGDHVFAVANSGVHHALNQSAYPTRVRESGKALDALRAHGHLDIEHLAELDVHTWESIRDDDPSWLDDILRDRVNHVASETERVRQGVDAIQQRDWVRFGELMTASGRSSANNYEISHPAVEELVAELNALPGVLGARMMGGGEGGPALALIETSAAQEIQDALAQGFFKRHDLEPDTAFEVCTFGPGATLSAPGNP